MFIIFIVTRNVLYDNAFNKYSPLKK